MAVSALAATAVFWFVLGVYAPREEAEALSMWTVRLEQSARHRSANLERAIGALYADAQIIAEYPTVKYLTTREPPPHVVFSDVSHFQTHLAKILGIVAARRGIMDICVVDAHGAIVTCAFDNRLPDPDIARALSAQVVAADEPALHHEPLSADSVWAFFAAPVHSARTGAASGAVVLVVNGRRQLLPLASGKLSGTSTGEAVLASRADHRKRRTDQDHTLQVARPLRNAPLVVAVRVGRAEALRATRNQTFAIGTAVIALALATVGLAWGFTTRLRTERKLVLAREAERTRQAEEQIRRSYNLLRAITEGTTDAIFVKDKEGRYIFINSAGARSLGSAPERVIGRTDVEVAGPEVAAHWRSLKDEVLEARAAVSRTQRVGLNGNSQTLQATVWPTFDGTGAVSGVIGIARDISEQVEAEQRFRSLFEKSSVGIAIASPEGRFIDVNPCLADMLRYAEGELCGRPVTDILSPEDHAEHHAMLRESSSGRSDVFTRRRRYKRKDGSYFYARLAGSLVRKADGTPDHFLAIIEDITEEHEAQQALEAAEQRYAVLNARTRVLLETNVVGVAVGTTDGKISDANDYFLNLIGRSRDELVAGDLRWTDITPPEDLALDRKAIAELRANGVVNPYEKQCIRKDGSRVWTLLGLALLPASKEEILAFAVDITTQKDLELQYQHAQKMEAVGRLAGGVAHDFNNILTAIKGIAALAVDETAANTPLRADLLEISECADRATALTRQLLAFSRRQVLKPRVFDVKELLRGMGAILGRLIGEDLDLRIECAPEALTVNADPSQIEQVVLNLAVNARDAMPRGGVLRVAASLSDPLLAVSEREGDTLLERHIILSVSDNGTGMDEETRKRAFEPFFTTKEPGKGTGLGLATVYGIVQQSAGSIVVDSVPGRGTTFTIRLPYVDAPIARPEKNGTGTHNVKRSVVLLVEDEEAVRFLVKRVIQRKGHRVLEARNAGEALLIAERCDEPLDLVITDLIMPGMSGQELVKRLRQKTPLKALFISGYAPDMIQTAKDSNDGFLEKPFTPQQLWQTMASTLAAH